MLPISSGVVLILPEPFHISCSVNTSTLTVRLNLHLPLSASHSTVPRLRFSLDALQATQIAERLGLTGAGLAEVEANMRLGGDLQGPGGPLDRPQALPLGRNTRTTGAINTPMSSGK